MAHRGAGSAPIFRDRPSPGFYQHPPDSRYQPVFRADSDALRRIYPDGHHEGIVIFTTALWQTSLLYAIWLPGFFEKTAARIWQGIEPGPESEENLAKALDEYSLTNRLIKMFEGINNRWLVMLWNCLYMNVFPFIYRPFADAIRVVVASMTIFAINIYNSWNMVKEGKGGSFFRALGLSGRTAPRSFKRIGMILGQIVIVAGSIIGSVFTYVHSGPYWHLRSLKPAAIEMARQGEGSRFNDPIGEFLITSMQQRGADAGGRRPVNGEVMADEYARVMRALELVERNRTTIFKCAGEYGLEPRFLAAIILIEQIDFWSDYPITEEAMDRFGASLGAKYIDRLGPDDG